MAFPAGAEKAPQAFRTISEVAAELEVPQHVLRFWETKFASVRPLKRGGGRRYYRPEDVDLLRGIRALLHRDGLTIKGVQKILKEQGVRYVMELGRGQASFIAVRAAPAGAASEGELPTNVHPFPRQPEYAEHDADVPPADRACFVALLDELLDLKLRLAAARQRASQSG
jgi:DNA-binding transcriptional MerR regulator